MNEVEVYRDVMVPMRDGVRLAADVYLPTGAGQLPAVLVRTAYDKSAPVTDGTGEYVRIARAGFAVVVQDKRGRFASEGEYRVLRDDATGPHRDGADTVEWVAAQPWCDGNVGMFGYSYLGETVLGAAQAAPPHLRAGAPAQPATDEFVDRAFVGGVLVTNIGFWASLPMVAEDLVAKLPADRQEKARAELDAYRAGLPESTAAMPLTEQPFVRLFPHAWGDVLAHRDDPDFFAESRFARPEAEQVKVPLLHIGSWLDHFPANTVRQYCLTRDHADPAVRDAQRLVMGPWGHGGFTRDEFGSVFPGSAVDYAGMNIEWLDRWLRGDSLTRWDHPVVLYVMGADRWRTERSWPVPGAAARTLALTADGALRQGDPSPGTWSFTYDPADPYRGGRLQDVGAVDLTALHEGDNLLRFETPALDADLEITGVPEAVLHLSTTATDADWHVELHAVGPDGTAMFVNEGAARARYRRSRTAPEPVEPGAVEEYVVGLRPMSVVIPAGGRLRMVLTAGKYPAFERNPQSFTDPGTALESDLQKADHTLHSGPGLSRLVLPVVDPARRGEWIDNPWPLAPGDAEAAPVERQAAELER
ncbi:CocE/NonD family hydrolase [Streptomyces sp. enrichment culture]|uniref:CocE/NonD family hydrolase n=1 Tax=Streptomyces sp. enrichment culture TaxID=1795815 RepID=UPI003F55829E